MASKEQVLQGFQFINITPSEQVLLKCVEMCNSHAIEPEDFVDMWFAYTASNLNGEPPSLEALEKMERKELKKNKDKINVNRTPVSTPKRYENESVNSNGQNEGNYSTPKSHRSLAEKFAKEKEFSPKSVDLNNSIITESENQISNTSSSQVEKYGDRLDSLSVKLSYGKEISSTSNPDTPLYIKNANDSILSPDARYMYEIMGRKAACINSMTQWVGRAIAKKHNLTFSENSTRNYSGEIITLGRICVDSGSRLNPESILLEGTQQLHAGHTVSININKVKKTALFPGQIVVVQGNNLNGTSLVAENIFTDGSLDLPLEPPVTQDSLHIIVASGPFTLQENLSYDPLKDLLNYVVENPPNILILMGPFLETTHPGIEDGTLTESFDIFFESLMASISVALENTNIQIVVISSQKDAHHHVVYPTPPYKIRENYANMKFYPDPCVLNINGLIFGATTADVSFHIGKEEFVIDKTGSDRMTRLVSHILQQQCFYPLYPPNTDVSVSHELLEEFGVFECLPHILLLPSNFRYYLKKIKECLVINPEKLTKGYVAGTFAKIVISPGTTRSVSDRISCKILRI